MDINRYLFHFGMSISVIFGGTFILRSLWRNELLIDQLYMCIIGICLTISAFIWRRFKIKKKL